MSRVRVEEGKIQIHDRDEIERIRESAQIVGRCLLMLAREVKEGVSTLALDRLAETFIRDEGGEPAFKGYRGFPASICASINEEVVHGIPSAKRFLRDGDIVSLDIGVRRKGYYGDAALTCPVGEVAPQASKLMETTLRSLEMGVAQARPGNRVSDISAAIEEEALRGGFHVVRALVGHGIGRELHEEPQVPNYGRPGEGPKLREGMVLAIEPMVNAGAGDVITLPDGWTVTTADRALSAHFEHTVAIGADGPQVLSRVEAN